MKKLLTEWRNFLKEAEAKYSGILKVKLNPDLVQKVQGLQQKIGDSKAISLPEKALHVTLIHQSILKPYRKQIKKMELPDAPEPIIDFDKGIQVKTDEGKMSWAVELKNQDQMRDYVRQVMELLGEKNTDPEPERIFHISLANLTGNPQDSVR